MPSLTLTFTASEASRIAAAYADKLRLGQSATTAEVKAALIAEVKSVVKAYEGDQARKAVAAPADVEPT